MTCTSTGNVTVSFVGPVIKLGKYRFEMHRYHGVLKLNKNDDYAITSFDSKFWPLYALWVKMGKRVDSDGNGIIKD